MRIVEIEKQDGQRRYVVIDEDDRLVEPIDALSFFSKEYR